MDEKLQGVRLRFIDHSGFLLETDRCSIIFDYYRGTVPDIKTDRPLYILSSHVHYDHFDPGVFALTEGLREVHCLLSDDIPPHAVPEVLQEMTDFMAPYEIYDDDCLHVETLRSNDQGVAFLLDVPHGDTTLRVYFAGDLNDWNWDGDAEDALAVRAYRAELARIKGQLFDIAFLLLDPRLQQFAFGGIEDFLSYADARCIVPMHMWGDYSLIETLAADPRSAAYRDRLLHIHHAEEEFSL